MKNKDLKKDSAIFKFNGGIGALLCSHCNVIIKIGKHFSELELKAFQGEIDLDPILCEKCTIKYPNYKFDKNATYTT